MRGIGVLEGLRRDMLYGWRALRKDRDPDRLVYLWLDNPQRNARDTRFSLPRFDHRKAAVLKELMRRSAQFQIESGTDAVLQQAAVDGAIEEMVFIGGAPKLLGGSATELGGTIQ